MKRICLLIALALVVLPAVGGCAGSPVFGSGSQPATESSARQADDLSTVTFYVPTVT